MLIKPRWFARMLASIGGYFWLPCPICKEPFAGFEWGDATLMSSKSRGVGVCPKAECKAEAKRRNRKLGVNY